MIGDATSSRAATRIFGDAFRFRETLCLLFLTLIAGFAVFWYGGMLRSAWNVCLLALGLLAAWYGLATEPADRAPPLDRLLLWLVVGLPAYVAFQLIPLPRSLLAVLSPPRGQSLESLDAVGLTTSFAPLTVAPSATLHHLLRICAYVIVFLLIRELAWRWSHRPWRLAWPIITLASLEAAVGVLQFSFGTSEPVATGTYVNRNHFAGLLELGLPFAVIYPVAVLSRVRPSHWLSFLPALKAAGGVVLAGLILTGILFSLSRMGFVAAVFSLAVMGMFGWRGKWWAARGQRLGARWMGAGTVVMLLMLSFIFLPSDALIERFGSLSSSEQKGVQTRLGLWQSTLDLVADYPLFGCGLGAYESAFLPYKRSAPLRRADYAHNDYLQLLSELGAIGFLVGVAFVVVISGRAAGVASGHAHSDGRFLGLACVGAFSAILLHSVVDFNLYIPANAMLLAWLAGLAEGLSLPAKVENTEPCFQ